MTIRTTPLICSSALLALAFSAPAEVLYFALSPRDTDAAIGLSTQNEVPPVPGEGSGDKILTGITYDTDTKILDYSIGYGSLGGFTNLSGPVTAAHIHEGATGVNGPVFFDFFAFNQHLPAGDPLNGGVIIGSLLLDQLQEDTLRAGGYYVNIHTAANPSGEIRGQLIEVDNLPPTIECPEAITAECTSADGAIVELTATVADPNGDALTVTWFVNGDEFATSNVPSGGETTEAEVSVEGQFGLGEHLVEVFVSDGIADPVSCTTTVTVADTTPPEIDEIKPSKWSLWPPNHKMKTIDVKVDATDACGEVTARILSVESNEPINGTGDGNTAPDWEITDDLVVDLRSERSGNGDGRIYTLTVEVSDEAGNAVEETIEVHVPKNKKAHKKLKKGPRD